MRKSDAFQGAFYKAEDFTTPATLTIKRIEMAEVGIDEGKRLKPTAWFVEGDKRLVTNSHNWDTIEGLYGPETSAWIGKAITLYKGPTQFKGKTVDGIHVLNEIPSSSGPKTGAATDYPDQPIFPDPTMQAVADKLSELSVKLTATEIVDKNNGLVDAFIAARDIAAKAQCKEAVDKFRATNRSTNAEVYTAALSLLIAADKASGESL